MLSEILDDVAEEVVADIGQTHVQSIREHAFIVDATAHNLLSTETQGLTIFLPLHYTTIDDHDDEFEEFFNRHVVRGIVALGGDGVKQLTTLSNLVVAVYAIDALTLAVAGVTLDSDMINCSLQGCMVHAIEAATLPVLRPLNDDIAEMRTVYLAGEAFDMHFEQTGIEGATNAQTFTLLSSFCKGDRTPIAETLKTPWHGNGTVCHIVIPPVPIRQSVMLWMQLYDNNHRHVILTMLWPWFLELVPNKDMHPNLDIDHIVPRLGRVDDEMCIMGRNFCSTDLRVTIGPNDAVVIHSSPSLIRCFIPQGSGIQPVWVANGNVYRRFDCFTYM